MFNLTHSAHTFTTTVLSTHERTYDLSFALRRDRTVTHTGAWLLQELEFNCDEVTCTVVGDSRLAVKILTCETERDSEQFCARVFETAENVIDTAWTQYQEHQAATAIFAQDLV